MGDVIAQTATIVTAVGALLSGTAPMVAALRRTNPVGEGALAADPRAGLIHRAQDYAFWSLCFGVFACLLAAGFLAFVGATTTALASIPLSPLAAGAGVFDLLGFLYGIRSLHLSLGSGIGTTTRRWRAAAGLMISLGVLFALLLARQPAG